MGAFLMQTLYQGDLVVSAMFLTAVAPNPLVAEFARQGASVGISWTTWAIAAAAPGAFALALVPYVVYRLCPPDLRDTEQARSLAAERLVQMGPITRDERVMLVVFIVVLVLWLSGEQRGVSATTVAYIGLSLLLLTRVLDWQDLLDETGAWDALIWFGGLVMLAGQFEKAGFPKAFAHASAGLVTGWPWGWALAGLVVVQIGLGAANVWLSKEYELLILAHLATATLLWGTLTVLNLQLVRIPEPAPEGRRVARPVTVT
jgi:DASS family divalent anion:Na+ symporter